MGKVRPPPRARNQAREPRRRKGAPAPAQARPRITRETGSARRGPEGDGNDDAMTEHDTS